MPTADAWRVGACPLHDDFAYDIGQSVVAVINRACRRLVRHQDNSCLRMKSTNGKSGDCRHISVESQIFGREHETDRRKPFTVAVAFHGAIRVSPYSFLIFSAPVL